MYKNLAKKCEEDLKKSIEINNRIIESLAPIIHGRIITAEEMIEKAQAHAKIKKGKD